MERLGAEIVRERIRARFAVAEHRNVVLHADDDLVGRERDVVARLWRTQPVDRLHRFHFLPDLLAHDFHRLLEERDDAARHGGIGDVFAVVHDLGLDLERHFDLRHGPERRGHLRAIQRQREREHARGEGVHLDGDERLWRAAEFADELDVGVVRLRVGRLESFALLEHRIERRRDFVRPVLDAEQLRDAIVPAQEIGAAKVRRQMQRLEFVHRRFRLAARAAGADAAHRGRHGQHALMPAVERERCLDEPAFKPPDAELLELPHAHERNRPELVRVNVDRPRPFGIRAASSSRPTFPSPGFSTVSMMPEPCAAVLNASAFASKLMSGVSVSPIHSLNVPGRRRREHPADAGPQRPHAQIALAEIAALAAFVGPQRAAQLVAEHERRKRHRAAIAGDELARDEVGVEIEIAHAGRGLSKDTPPYCAAFRSRLLVRRFAFEREEERIEGLPLVRERRIERRLFGALLRLLGLALPAIGFRIERHRYVLQKMPRASAWLKNASASAFWSFTKLSSALMIGCATPPASGRSNRSGAVRCLRRDEPRGVLEVPEDEVLRVRRPRFIGLVVRRCARWRDDPDRRHLQLIVLRVARVEQRPIHEREALLLRRHILRHRSQLGPAFGGAQRSR